MHLPTWGKEFNKVREEAYTNPTPSILKHYILARGMGFCENCGSPHAQEVLTVAQNLNPRSLIAVCPSCEKINPETQQKGAWLEDNLSEGRLLYVTAAIILDAAGSVMVCQRANSLWEFPGGKMDDGEDLVTCLRREIKEELSIELSNIQPFTLVDHDYGRVKLRLYSFTASLSTPAELIELHDHIDFAFKPISTLSQVGLSQADVCIAQKLGRSVT